MTGIVIWSSCENELQRTTGAIRIKLSARASQKTPLPINFMQFPYLVTVNGDWQVAISSSLWRQTYLSFEIEFPFKQYDLQILSSIINGVVAQLLDTRTSFIKKLQISQIIHHVLVKEYAFVPFCRFINSAEWKRAATIPGRPASHLVIHYSVDLCGDE